MALKSLWRRLTSSYSNPGKSRFNEGWQLLLKWYLFPTGVVVLFLGLWVKSQAIDFDQHVRYLNDLQQLQELDARINQNVLQVRQGLLNYYDPIVNDLRELKHIQMDLMHFPTFIDPTDQAKLSPLLQTHIQVLQHKEQIIQQFQTQNAILTNSLAYFPIATVELIKQPESSANLLRLNTLMQNILLFNLSPTNPELAPKINQDIERILMDSSPIVQRPTLKNAIAHARIILNHRPQVDDLMMRLMALPTQQSSKNLAQEYERSYQRALNTVSLYRFWLYLLSTMLVIGIAILIIVKFRTAAETLRLSETKFRNIFENSLVGIFRTRLRDGLLLDANQRCVEILGYESASEVIGLKRSVEFYVDSGDRQRALNILRNTGEVRDFEARFHKSDGTIFWGLFSLRLNRTENCLEGVLADITNLKEAEAALQRSELKYRNLFENSQVGMFRVRISDALILDANQRLLTMIGYDSPAEVIGIKHSFDFDTHYNPQRQHSVPLDWQIVENVERLVQRRDGTTFWALSSARINAEEGCYEGMLADISDRKQMEEDLRRSHALLKAQQEVAIDGILVVDETRRVISYNHQFCQIWQIPESLVQGGSDQQLLEWVINQLAQPEEFLARVEYLYVHPKETSREEISLRDGRTLDRYSAAIQTQEGEIYGRVWYFRDISDRKQAEEKMLRAMAAAEVANRAKSQFLSNMSHELRTPLNVILGFTQLMARGDALTPQQQSYLETISRSGEHLLALINDVLEMSKIEAGKTTLNVNDFDLYALLDELQPMFQFKADSKGLQLLSERAIDLPHYIRSDESKLRQVLLNLLGNAIKFTQTGRVTLRVGWAVNPESQEQPPDSLFLIFEVEDTGPGIAPHDLEQLFEPFVQTDSGLRSQEGTGLGLPISRKFVQLMGGDITVESQLGSGSLFRFTIQAQIAEAVKFKPPAPDRQIIGLESGQPTYRILIAEDKPENRQLLVELLKPIGFEVQEAENGQAAIDLYQRYAPHLILMDLRMPVMDGYKATQYIKAASNTAPVIIALTGSAFEEERSTALSVGCDDFMRKPFRATMIFEKLAEHLGVRYRYAEALVSPISAPSLATQTPLHSPDFVAQQVHPQRLTPEDLAVMSPEWIEQLHQAAIRVNTKLLLAAIAQIPESHAQLIRALTHLVENCRFEALVALTQP